MDSRANPPIIDATVLDAAGPPAGDVSGLRRRRCFAWAIDAVICTLLAGLAAIPAFFLGVLTLGLLWGPAWILVALVPLIYHAVLVSGPRGATWGQRFAGVEFVALIGGRASFLQAAVHWVLFYVGVAFTGGLILVWSLFAPQKALLHDQVAGLFARRAPGTGGA